MKKTAWLLCFAAIFVVNAQDFDGNARQLDVWLKAKTISAADAAAILLPASGIEVFSLEEAFLVAKENNSLPKKVTEQTSVTIAQFAYMAAKTFHYKKSLFFIMIPVPRYAYRDLKYLRIIQFSDNPKKLISGRQALQIASRLMDLDDVQ